MAQHFLLSPAQAGSHSALDGASRRDNRRLFGTPSQLVVAGGIGIIILTIFFLMATFNAVRVMDDLAIQTERDRAAIAVGLAQQSGRAVDSVIAGKIGRDYLLNGVRLARPGQLAAEEISIPVAGSSLVLTWTPRRLGSETFVLVAPYRIVAGGLCSLGLLFILFRLYKLARDLEARRRAARELASRDPLTGLANRRGFMEALDAGFNAGKGLSLLYLDLDDFKQVNDRYGHATGDQLLLCVAQRLAHVLGGSDHLARLGGDEFVILRKGPTTHQDLVELAKRIHARVTLPYGLGDIEAAVGLSIGIATRTANMHHSSDLVAAADAALYRAKAIDGTPFAFAEELVEGLPKAA